jgi:hypothetical protein
MATTSSSPQTGTDLRTRTHTTRALLDDAAALVNGVYATALRVVMDAFAANVHRDGDGFSAPAEWLRSQFDFTASAAGDIAVIAKYANKFTVLAQTALAGSARIDQTAYAVRSLAKTPASALFAKTPFRVPVPSPSTLTPSVRARSIWWPSTPPTPPSKT